ncbi:hypothetical protein FA13DRAFT_1646529 [Coprinellus micaceus]|uniref:Uncharacterized protein n=1 Tax=Coprinellus micaceus TaxID=71717 RepID=A0A4Y7SF48_COPMI|nr:hypothetical protein FA13DRAFT_1646529 [Coprinellus micaceus]
MLHHPRRRPAFPFSTYGENALLLVQNTVITFLSSLTFLKGAVGVKKMEGRWASKC